MSEVIIPDDWYVYNGPDAGVREDHPGAYEWEIAGIVRYIGKFSRVKRPRTAYTNSLREQKKGLPWHGRAGARHRLIQRLLYKAHLEGVRCTLYLRENIGPYTDVKRRNDLLNELEQRWEALRRTDALRGGLPVVIRGQWYGRQVAGWCEV